MSCVSNNGNPGPEPPEKTDTELEAEKREIENLATQAADAIDSDDADDDVCAKVPYCIDDIGQPPPKNSVQNQQGRSDEESKRLIFLPRTLE